MKKIAVLILLSFHITLSYGHADSLCILSCCCGNDPTPAGVMISHVHAEKEWMVSYKYMDMHMSDAMKGNAEISDNEIFSTYLMAPGEMKMQMHMLMAMYGITPRLTAMAMFSYRQTSMDMKMFAPGGSHHHSVSSVAHDMKTSGVGDAELHLLYALLRKTDHQLLISAGASFPSGSIDEKDNTVEEGVRLPYSMQPGSGSIHILPGLTWVWQRNRITWSLQGNASIPSGTNDAGYKYGEKFTGNAWFSYDWLPWLSSSVRTEYIHAGKISGADRTLYIYNEPSSNPQNYGSKTLLAHAGAVFQIRNGFLRNHRAAVEFGMPLSENYNGIQQHLDHVLNASWSFTF